MENRHLSHLNALRKGFGTYDPKDFDYEGQVIDAGMTLAFCACGHPIRYIFKVNHKTLPVSVQIGSTCIEFSFPYLNEMGAKGLANTLHDALKIHLEQIAEAKRKIRDMANDEIAQEFLAYWELLEDWHTSTIDKWKILNSYLPSYLWAHKSRFKLHSYSTPGRMAGSLRRKICTQYFEALKFLQVYQDYPKHPRPYGILAEIVADKLEKEATRFMIGSEKMILFGVQLNLESIKLRDQ
ncbi:hypothetical protein LCGC14_1311460 [marine sediment metagenome]|uniref:Uncharacterized protein n=1 Tax=marine sediment metagenome TaxID=412755 RepID=A0A0F9KM77_9ZZZZ